MPEHEHHREPRKKLFGLNRLVAYSAIVVAIPTLFSILAVVIKTTVTFWGLPDQVESNRSEMTNMMATVQADNDVHQRMLRQEMEKRFDRIEIRLDLMQAQTKKNLHGYDFQDNWTSNGLAALWMSDPTNAPIAP